MTVPESQISFSRELRLVLLTAKTRLGEAERAELTRLCRESLHWETVLKLAGFHRTLPLLNLHLANEAGSFVPAKIIQQLRTQFQLGAQRNLFLARELIKILDLFHANGIAAVPFKGPLLAIRFYGHIGYRNFLDLDLLVRKDSVLRAAQLLEFGGYVRPDLQTGVLEQEHLQSQLGFDFRRSDGKVQVELNWALIQKWLRFRLDPEALWTRLGRARLAGVEIPVLEVEDEFLFLCAHGAKHQWERAFWISDLGEIIRACPSLNWDRLLARSKQTGSRRVLLWGVRLAHDLLGAEVPPHVLKLAQDDAVVGQLTRKIMEQLAAQQEPQPGPQSKSDMLYLLEKERFTDKGAYLVHLGRLLITPTAKDRQFAKLPQALSAFYFLLRPFRVLSERLLPRLRAAKGS